MTESASLFVKTNAVPRWRYEAFRRWFVPSPDAREAVAIRRDSERQAGER